MAKKETTKTVKAAIEREQDGACTSHAEREQARPLTPDGIFRKFESVVPKGATTIHVLEAAATLIVASLVQMNASRQDLHNVMAHLEEYAAKKVEFRKKVEKEMKAN